VSGRDRDLTVTTSVQHGSKPDVELAVESSDCSFTATWCLRKADGIARSTDRNARGEPSCYEDVQAERSGHRNDRHPDDTPGGTQTAHVVDDSVAG
jgi:hypothetical protein